MAKTRFFQKNAEPLVWVPDSVYFIKTGTEKMTIVVTNQEAVPYRLEASGGGGSEVNDLSDTVTWAEVPDGFISESSVIQHINKSLIDALGIDALTLNGVSASVYADKYTQSQVDTLFSNLGTVASSNDYNDLDNTPNLSIYDNFDDYADLASFPVTGETGVMYLARDTGYIYRWNGAGYSIMSAELALGETASTAYRGDRGKAAYDHSLLSSGNPHGVTKSEIGLGNVDNTSDVNKPISTAQQAALDAKQETLSSGSNIKTVNGVSILGSGDLPVSASAGGSNQYVQYNNAGALAGAQEFLFDLAAQLLKLDAAIEFGPIADRGDLPLVHGDLSNTVSRLFLSGGSNNNPVSVVISPGGSGTSAQIQVNNTDDLANRGRLRFRVSGTSAEISVDSVGSPASDVEEFNIGESPASNSTGNLNEIAFYFNKVALFTMKSTGVLNLSSLPTSSAGLSSGDLWNDSGTVKIV